MVIQPNMSPKAIVEVWEITESIFNKYHIPLSKRALETLVREDQLSPLLEELNVLVGSSTETCTEGG